MPDADATRNAKQFGSMEIQSDATPFTSISYQGQYQSAEHDPFVNPTNFWIDPKWAEGKWLVPIQVQTSGTEDGFAPNAQMRNEWLKVTLKYTGNKAKFVKNVITDFIISRF